MKRELHHMRVVPDVDHEPVTYIGVGEDIQQERRASGDDVTSQLW